MSGPSTIEDTMILDASHPALTVIERFDVPSADLGQAVAIAAETIRDIWTMDPAFIAALILCGREGGLAVYAQWCAAPGDERPATVHDRHSLRGGLSSFALRDSRTYTLAFTRQAPTVASPTRLSVTATPFIHFGVFTVTRENQSVMIARAEVEAPNSFGTPGLLAIDFHRSIDGLQVLNLGAWSTFEGFKQLHDRPSFKPGEQYFHGIADMFRPEFYRLVDLIAS